MPASVAKIMFKILDKITVTNFVEEVKEKEAKLAKVNGEYYLLGDPSLYKLIKVKDTDYYVFKEDIPYHEYYFNSIEMLYSIYINQQLGNTLNIFKVLILYQEGKLLLEILNGKLLVLLEKHKTLPTDVLADLSDMLERLSAKKPRVRIVLDPAILEAVKYYLEVAKANKALEKVSIKEFLMKVRYELHDRIEFPTTTELMAEIDQLIELLTQKERAERRKREQREDKPKDETKDEQEITITTNGSASSPSPSNIDTKTNDNIGTSTDIDIDADVATKTESTDIDIDIDTDKSGSLIDNININTTTTEPTNIPLPYLRIFEVYANKPLTQHDETEIARMIINYMKTRDRVCRVNIR